MHAWDGMGWDIISWQPAVARPRMAFGCVLGSVGVPKHRVCGCISPWSLCYLGGGRMRSRLTGSSGVLLLAVGVGWRDALSVSVHVYCTFMYVCMSFVRRGLWVWRCSCNIALARWRRGPVLTSYLPTALYKLDELDAQCAICRKRQAPLRRRARNPS
jgi:hypothetical protein